ncbi:MAG: inverse autotransporter beta domain-containing protein [Bacillota bacterium]
MKTLTTRLLIVAILLCSIVCAAAQPQYDFAQNNNMSEYYATQYDNSGTAWLRGVELNGMFDKNSQNYGVTVIQPFLDTKNGLTHVPFWQASYTRTAGANLNSALDTVNIGIGYRFVSAVRSNMYGVNLFYDNCLDYLPVAGLNQVSLQRIGAGLEYFVGPVEARMNGYLGLGNNTQTASNGDIVSTKVVNGLDGAINTDFSFWNAPWLKIGVSGFSNNASTTGITNGCSATAALQLMPQLKVAVAQDFINNNTIATATINLLALPQPALLFADEYINANAEKDAGYKTLLAVQRNNNVTADVNVTRQAVVYQGSLDITVTDSATGLPLAGVMVVFNSTLQNTGADGKASFSNIAYGNYDYVIVKSGYLSQSSSCTIDSPAKVLPVALVVQ